MFECNDDEGAVVIPLADVTRRYIHPDRARGWQDYVQNQRNVWAEISRQSGPFFTREEMLLINGLIVTKRWANALFVGRGRYEITLNLSTGVRSTVKTPPGGKAELGGAPARNLWLVERARVILGPAGENPPDQILFVQGYHWKPAPPLMKLFGASSVKGAITPRVVERNSQQRKNSSRVERAKPDKNQ